MNIYSLIFVGGYFTSVLSTLKETKTISKVNYSIIMFTLLVISALRSLNVGYDNVDHERNFYSIANGEIRVSDFKEPGYSLLSYIVSFFGEYHLFLIIYAIISIVILRHVIK